ncbi:hypothetical protein J1605_000752 [Eschrichtius robustus]|uniref:Uncharacterized protein n=1 Tax=Eschrichtius robustus TaxID=9764 RepID=A0AB34GQK4_ESCRO|nr:hypothetical protein J1605_000752 [Eschrichtius robustus]
MEGMSALLARYPTAGLAGGLGVTACAAAGVLLYRIARSPPAPGPPAPRCPCAARPRRGGVARPVCPRAETHRARPAPGKKTGLGIPSREAAEEWVGGPQECGAGGDSQRVRYELLPPRRPALAQPQGLQGPQTLRERRAGVGPCSFPS